MTNYICKNPKFSNYNKTSIDVMWQHPELGDIPFTASKGDTEAHGREIYQLALAGEFGEVMLYDGPSLEEQESINIRYQRDELLSELDVIVSNPLRYAEFSEEEKSQIAAYRQALLDVPQQETFPDDVDWPAKPEFL
ncbi:tail fiber assembly protein [Oligella urethralis]|uniref:tail fiber assembly protein n=1 Tax=Oligella urethralis TaxID=90245 RepID=UPI000DFB5D3D|nr:tail fiber assembly protein [Oligella urethralis]SUA58339.1 Uncharacterised protein [Oligella urethralis]